MLKKEWLNAKPKHFLLPLATTTFINALIHSEKISIKMHKNKKISKQKINKNVIKKDNPRLSKTKKLL